MVSVSHKESTLRTATATGTLYLPPHAFNLISPPATSAEGSRLMTKKGDVLSIAQLAGIMGAKYTSSLIPLCHPLSLTHITVTLDPQPPTSSIFITATTECRGPTGVEMEALIGVNVAGMTVWDMMKAVAGREMIWGNVKVVVKSGGKSGDWERRD